MKHELIQSGKSYLHLQPLLEEVLQVRYTDLERERTVCQELLLRSQAEEYRYGQAFARTYLGDYYIARNDGNMAGDHLKQATALCQGQNYTELSMNLNIFYGLYYDMLLDQFMSLTCTLEALDLAIELEDHQRESTILNNIANMFETFGDLDAAMVYYREAMACLGAPDIATKNTSHFAVMTANLIQLSCHFGNVEAAEAFLTEFDDIDLNNSESRGQYLVSCCHLAATRQDFPTIRHYADQVIALLSDRSLWGYQFFEILIHLSKFALDFQDKSCAHQILTTLDDLSGDRDPGNLLRVQTHWVRYYEMFGTEAEQSKSYKRYYQLKEIIDVTNNKTMSAGLHAKISLRQAKKKQEEMVKIAEKLENEAQSDELTQLYNRRSFANLSDRVTEDASVRSLGLVMIDVDYFKQYNDTYGHAEGDVALRAVADCMTQAANKSQWVYNFRYGGDEFVCMYENCTEADLEHYVKTLADLVRRRAIPHCQSRCSDVVSLSIGYHRVVRAKNAPLDTTALLAKADKALYWSKGRGRDGSSRYTAEMESTLSRTL